MLVTTNAIVFNAIKYGEADLIVKCFTEKKGIKTYILRGILKSRKGKLRASLFQPLTQLEIVADHKEKGTLEYLKEAKIVRPYLRLHTDVIKLTVVFFLAEMLQNTIVEEEPNEVLFDFLQSSLSWFDMHEKAANFHLFFLLKLTKYLGFYPDGSGSSAARFDLREGRFRNSGNSKYCISDEDSKLLRKFLGTNFEALSGIRLSHTHRTAFLSMILKYYELHLQGFRRPKSLSVLNEIFY